ncbi:MAG: MFS transporter [Gammaproteobacteria bacterium]|nr:MFS transporter [Gammaproteobacteria bacterium]
MAADKRQNTLESNKREILAWACYDWANSAYATVVMAGFFPIFFREYWSAGQASTDITLHLGMSNSIASVFVIAALPLLGAVADVAGWRKRLLLTFATFGIVATFCMFWIAPGAWLLAAGVYALATIGFAGANAFYDSLLIGVAPRHRYDTVSALGFALGYLGGGLLFALCVVMYSFPDAFGFEGGAQVVRVSFLLTASWWCLFSLPLMMFVREPPHAGRAGAKGTLRAGFRRLAATLKNIRELHMVALFLVAYWCYIDGVDTVVLLAVDYGKALGFETGDLILALLLVQFVGFPATIAFGFLGQKLGTKTGILIAVGVYILVLCWGATINAAWEFYVLAASIGLVQGGIQSLSRAFYARLIPPEKAAELFGFYNMLGKFAAIVGPVMVGWTGVLTGSHRLGILSLLVLFIAGAIVLMFVKDPEASTHAAADGATTD